MGFTATRYTPMGRADLGWFDQVSGRGSACIELTPYWHLLASSVAKGIEAHWSFCAKVSVQLSMASKNSLGFSK
jgi:hypothetical protein